MDAQGGTTWDGIPISQEPPFGASIVVYRRSPDRTELLLLHRALPSPTHEGDWAWTTPAGARQPNESIERCARRELWEETGLDLPLQTENLSSDPTWAAYAIQIDMTAAITLDAEHDRYEWVDIATALTRCHPIQVSDTVRHVLACLNLLR